MQLALISSPTLIRCTPVFQEISILQSKKSGIHQLEKERDEAVHRLQVSVCHCTPPVHPSTAPRGLSTSFFSPDPKTTSFQISNMLTPVALAISQPPPTKICPSPSPAKKMVCPSPTPAKKKWYVHLPHPTNKKNFNQIYEAWCTDVSSQKSQNYLVNACMCTILRSCLVTAHKKPLMVCANELRAHIICKSILFVAKSDDDMYRHTFSKDVFITQVYMLQLLLVLLYLDVKPFRCRSPCSLCHDNKAES